MYVYACIHTHYVLIFIMLTWIKYYTSIHLQFFRCVLETNRQYCMRVLEKAVGGAIACSET